MKNELYGKLYIVATPIGNLGDITYRAVETLKKVELIACEDTRRTRELLNHLNIEKKTISYHKYSDEDKVNEIIDIIKSGKDVALVTDAGTPIISDPGDTLVNVAVTEEIEVVAVPGACALINALVVSNISAKSFVFYGFLPDDNKQRKKIIDNIKDETKTMIFYVSTHDINKILDLLMSVVEKDRRASISREMTKIHEENVRGSLYELSEYYKINETRGEFVLVLSGKDEKILETEKINRWNEMDIYSHYKYYIDLGVDEKEALKKVAKDRGIRKNEVYKIIKVEDN